MASTPDSCSGRMDRARRATADGSRPLAAAASSIRAAKNANPGFSARVDDYRHSWTGSRVFRTDSGNHRNRAWPDGALADQKVAPGIYRKVFRHGRSNHRLHKSDFLSNYHYLVYFGRCLWVISCGCLEFIYDETLFHLQSDLYRSQP